jgi:hypothetical protein
MQLGSPEHKALLVNSIRRTFIKTSSLGLFIGVLLLIPHWVRENTFSIGLAYMGWTVMIIVVSYATFLAWQKYQKLIKNFDHNF